MISIILQLLLALGVLFLMGFLGVMLFAFCFMVNGKLEDDEKENEK